MPFSEIREEGRLIYQVGRLQVGERPAKAVLGHVGYGHQERERHILPNDGGGLKQRLLLG
jgi:hypothetical protein